MTQKDELSQATAKIKELQPKADAHDTLKTRAETAEASLLTAEAGLKAAEQARDSEKLRADTAENALKAATDRAEKAEKDASDLKAKAEGLEQNAKTTGEKAREQNARMGLTQQTKSDDVVTGAGEDIAAVAEIFTNPKTSMSEKAALLKKHGSKLVAYAGSIPNRG